MSGLERCPLCGGEGQIKDVRGPKIRQGWVGCPACSLYINWKISPDGAVRKWNRRTDAGRRPRNER
ncbi:MAG: Lar family restriction alleviation protein [Clostridia bacterium]|nr:Lar family restriction alleviation protein [Clostridia bacterium]